MSRYIDADGIDIRAREGYKHDGVLYIPYRDVIKSLDSAPSIDIVRCGECKHRDPEDKKCDCGHGILWQLPRTDEWFCADGEREGE